MTMGHLFIALIIIVGFVFHTFLYIISYRTYHAATGEHDSEPVNDTRRANHPRQPNEQNDSEDILHARQVDADQRAHPG